MEYNGKIGFAKREFLLDYTDENIYCNLNFMEVRKKMQVKDTSFIYLEPFDEANVIYNISKDNIIDTIAITSNGWYLVNINGLIGFIREDNLKDVHEDEIQEIIIAEENVNIRKKPSTKSERYNILYKNDELPYIGETKDFYVIDYYGYEAYVMKKFARKETRHCLPIDFIKLVYAKKDTFLYSAANKNANVIDYVDKYQTLEVLVEEGDFYFVKYNDSEGFVYKNDTKLLDERTIVVDLSSQKLMVYEKNKLLFKTNVVTGSDYNPTNEGKFNVQDMEVERYLKGEDYNTFVNFWVQYDNNYGIHDLNMNGEYGGNTYHKNGSHGCVRMHIIPMEKFYSLVKRKTPVIIQK